MKTDLEIIARELYALTTTEKCLVNTFIAIERGLQNDEECDPRALCVPIAVLRDTVKKLELLQDELQKLRIG